MKRRVILLVAAVSAAAAVGAYASIPAGNGVITACLNAKGALKVIDGEAGESCGSQQTLTWNQQGPTGPAGTSGRVIVSDTSVLSSYVARGAQALCPAGKSVVGGGGKAFAVFNGAELNPVYVALAQSHPYVSGNVQGWSVYANETAAYDDNWAVRAYAICATTT